MGLLSFFFRLILYILPSYFANSVPVLLGGGEPIDMGRKLSDGQRLFGDGKTIRGFFAGVAAGTLIGALECIALAGGSYDLYGGSAATYVLAGFLLGLGTMLGDLAGSFIKRRQKIDRGKPSLALDQLAFLLFAFLLSWPLASRFLTIEGIVFLAVLTYIVHVVANVLAHRLGLKKVPW
jgi:CDP-2,3-bis-(O-geranylgeranyl)-sn-glycerol synthase